MDISVVVPTCGRPELLARCLDALEQQDYPTSRWEVIVVVDGQDRTTENLVAAMKLRSPIRVRYVAREHARGPAAARNLGWRSARGTIIAFTDDDCIPQSNWLSKGWDALVRDQEALAVAGKIIVPISFRPTDYERDVAGLEATEFVTANCFCRRGALEIIGGFDERFRMAWREDSDLQFSLIRLNGRVIRDESIRVIHPVRTAKWGESLRQQKKCLYDALLFKKHRDLFRRRITPSTPWLYYVILALLSGAVVASLVGQPGLAILLLALWSIATAWFVVKRLRRTSRSPMHVLEMIVTSAMIPPLSVFWRLYGAAKFRVWFV